jgi:phage-related protein
VPTQAVFYRDERGRQPVRDFLRADLPWRAWIVVKGQIEELNGIPDDHAPLPFPKTSQLEGGLRELRCHSGSDLFRILYRRSGNLFVLLHVVRKDSRGIPRRDMELAQRRWRNFKRRMDAPVRRGPRAAGEDAP